MDEENDRCSASSSISARENSRLLPFFGLYLLLFGALSFADGLTLTLFLKNVGSPYLPRVYGLVAVANLLVMILYVLLAEKAGSVRVFQIILAANVFLFQTAWIVIRNGGGADVWYGILFASREIAFTLVLMHFGTFLQDYFTREELTRVLPLVYAGGRVGGIAGGYFLKHLSESWEMINLLGVFVSAFVFGMLYLAWIGKAFPLANKDSDHLGDPGVRPPRSRDDRDVEAEARDSYTGFLHFVWLSPLLFWSTLTTLVFVNCRWILNFQYSSFFNHYFAKEQELAEFLGEYTQVSLAISLLVQLFLVNRLIAWLGLKGTHLLYGFLLLGGMAACLGEMTFSLAVFARFVESELRFGLRNPIMMLITNKFSKRSASACGPGISAS